MKTFWNVILIGLLFVLNLYTLSLIRSDMVLSDLLLKMAKGEQLTVPEREQLRLEARRLEDTATIINSMLRPGTNTLVAQRVETGSTIMDDGGVVVKNRIGGDYAFYDDDGNRYTLRITATEDNHLQLVDTAGGAIQMFIAKNSGSSESGFELKNDTVVDRLQLEFYQTYLTLKGGLTSPAATPSNPLNNGNVSETNIYVKQGKLIFMYNDLGTIRWKYLDLTGTGVTWVHTTSAP